MKEALIWMAAVFIVSFPAIRSEAQCYFDLEPNYWANMQAACTAEISDGVFKHVESEYGFLNVICEGSTRTSRWGSIVGNCPAQPPKPFSGDDRVANPKRECGSDISVDSQAVSESVALVGTPLSLVYRSDEVPGRTANRLFEVPLVSSTSTTTVDAHGSVEIAGRTLSIPTQTNVAPGTIYQVAWDGLDSSGNPVAGSVSPIIALSHEFPDIPLASGWSRIYIRRITSLANGDGFVAHVPDNTFAGNYDKAGTGLTSALGGWRISAIHYYDPTKKQLNKGNGEIVSVTAEDTGTLYRVLDYPIGLVYEFEYTGRMKRALHALTGQEAYTLTYSSDRLTKITDGFGNETTIVYVSGVPTKIVAPRGQETLLSMDTNGWLAEINPPGSGTYTMTSGSTGLLATFTKPSGEVSTFTYDTYGRLTKDASSAGPEITLSRSYVGPIKSVSTTTKLGRTTQNVISTSYGTTTRTTTSPSGLSAENWSNNSYVGTSEPTFSATTTKGLDPRFGHPRDSGVWMSSWSYSSNVSESQSVSLSGSSPFDINTLTSTVTKDSVNWVTVYVGSTKQFVTTSPVGRVSMRTIDDHERPVSTQLASFAASSFTYDTYGRLATIGQSSRTTTLAYNSDGFISSITNPLSQATSFSYDAQGRVLTQTLPDTRVITYTYDAGGNLSSITPPSSSTHSFTTNLMGMISDYAAPSLGSGVLNTLYTYNNDRQLTSVTRPNGDVISLSYGSTTGLLNSMQKGTNQFTYTYQYGDQLQSSTSPDGVTTAYTYQGILPTMVEYTAGTAGKISFSYGSGFKLASTQINSDSSYSYGYDNDELIVSAGSESLSRSSTTGFVTSTALGGATEAYTYDSTYGEVASYQGKYDTNNHLLESYTRDALGRILTRAETVGTGSTNIYTYSYDSAGRLILVQKNGTTLASYVYDSNSNRTSVTRNGVTTTGTYDAQDRIVTWGTKTYTHNLNGERTQKSDSSTSPASVTTYTYDAWGNLKTVQVPSGTTYSYLYDGQNRRVAKFTGSTLNEQYVYLDQTRIAAALDSSGSTAMTFVWGHKANIPEYVVKSGVAYKYFVDHLGSARRLVNTTDNTIAQELKYDEFGRVLSDSNPGFQPFGFAGGLYDQNTKLVHFGARDYDPETGRWLSKDPILFAGGDTNLYGYVLQDPVNWIDPDGKCPFCALIAAPVLGGIVGGAVGGIGAAVNGGNWSDIRSGIATGAIGGAVGGLGLATGLGAAAATAAGLGASLLTALPDSGANPAEVGKGLQLLLNPPTRTCPQ